MLHHRRARDIVHDLAHRHGSANVRAAAQVQSRKDDAAGEPARDDWTEYCNCYQGADVVGEWVPVIADSGTRAYCLYEYGTGRRPAISCDHLTEAVNALLSLHEALRDDPEHAERKWLAAEQIRKERMAACAIREHQARPWHVRMYRWVVG